MRDGSDGFSFDPEVGPDWWTLAPTRLLRARGLSPTAKLLYLVLASYAMEKATAWPGQERLARDCDVTRPTLRAALRELLSTGLVEQRRRGQGLTNLYHLHKVPDTLPAPPQKEKILPSGSEGKNLANRKANDLPSGTQESFPEKEAGEKETEEDDPSPALDLSSTAAPRYSAFLAAVVLDHASELGAGGRGPAAVGEILSLWQASGLDETAFATRLHEARAAVRKAQRPGVDKWRLYLAAVRAGG